MNAQDAIEKLREKQLAMMLEAQKMEQRAEQLQAIAICQDEGYHWQVVRVDLNDDKMKANRIVLKCAKSSVEVDAVLVHPPPLVMNDEYGYDSIELSEFLSERREEE